jgi:hypothetical protein
MFPSLLLMVLAWIVSSFMPTKNIRRSIGGSGSKNAHERVQQRLTSRIAELAQTSSDSWKLFETQLCKLSAHSYTSCEAHSLGHVLCLADIECLDIADGLLSALTLQQRFAIDFWCQPESLSWLKVQRVVQLQQSIPATANSPRPPTASIFTLHSDSARAAMEACDQHALHALLNKANASAAGGASSSASQVEGAPIQETITLAIQYWPAIAWLISHGLWQDCSLPTPGRLFGRSDIQKIFPEICQVHSGNNMSWLNKTDSANNSAANLNISSLRHISDNIRLLGTMLSDALKGLASSITHSLVVSVMCMF